MFNWKITEDQLVDYTIVHVHRVALEGELSVEGSIAQMTAVPEQSQHCSQLLCSIAVFLARSRRLPVSNAVQKVTFVQIVADVI